VILLHNKGAHGAPLLGVAPASVTVDSDEFLR